MSEHADPIPPVEVEAPEVPPEERVSRLDPETRARRDAALRLVRKYGDELLIEASGLEARVIQHEMDHLDGVLILERTSREERKQAMRILREDAKAAPLGVAS